MNLIKTRDILLSLSALKKEDQLLIGFSAESENLLENSYKKLLKKNLNYIIANKVEAFNSDDNEVYIIDKLKKHFHVKKDSKENIARKIVEFFI